MIEFHLDPSSGVASYLQIVQQVKNALRLDMLRVGDQLPTVREAVAALVINPNTVLKAYRDLEHEGLVVSRPGQGTFVVRTLAGASIESHAALRRGLARWLREARGAGLDDESIHALFMSVFREAQAEKEETA